MNLTKRQIRFLKPARSRDRYRENLTSMWCIKHRRVAVAVDGFTLHAIPIPEPASDFPFRAVEDVNGQAGFSLVSVSQDAPNIDHANIGPERAHMYINPKLLMRTLNAIGATHILRLSIVRRGKELYGLVVQGSDRDFGSFYALIAGMHPGAPEEMAWSPFTDQAKEKVETDGN